MELEGSLKAFSLPEILQFLSIGKMTGTLSVSSGKRTINVMIKNGKIINTSSFATGRKLGSMLLHHGKLQRRQLEEALTKQREPGEARLLGQILVEEGYIDQSAIHDHIRMQLQEEVWDLFRLDDGDFKFEHGEPQQVGDIVIELDIEPLIIEGTRQLDEWHRIIKNIPGDEYIVRLVPQADDFEPIPLTDEEWKVLSYINGRLTIGAIVAKSTIGKFETYNNLNTFLSAGMIELQQDFATSEERGSEEMEEFVIPMGGGAPIKPTKKASAESPNLINRYFTDDPHQKRELEGKWLFMSPVGQTAHFINLVVQKVWNHNDFVPAPEDSVLLEKKWYLLLNEYFMGDVIAVRGNDVDASAFEKQIGYYGGLAHSIRTSYEDALHALVDLAKLVTRFANDRVGKKTADSIVQEVLGELRQRSSFRVEDDDHNLEAELKSAAA